MDYSTQPAVLSPVPVSPIHAQPAASRRRAALSPPHLIAAMKISVYEAFPAQIFLTLTGGVFMPAFALALGANNFYIGALAAVIFTALPWVWLLTFKSSFSYYFMIPLLHAAGGFFWAGYNLCSTNLMFRLAARERNSIYFGAWAACNGLAACAGSLLGGALGRWAALHQLDLFFSRWLD